MRHTFSEKYLGTPVRLLVVCDGGAGAVRAASLAKAAYAECARIEAAYSRFLEGNELAALNAQVGEWAEVSAELYALLEFGEELKRRTGGAFDLSVKSILEGWGYDVRYSFAEGAAGRVGALELGGVADGAGRVRLSAPVELGGLGKGYAIDRVAGILQGGEVEGFLIDAGGDLRVAGRDEGGALWRVAFEHPTDVSQAIGIFEGTDLALACSSPSRRQWGGVGSGVGGATASGSGARRHHLVDPCTGKPAEKMLAVYTQVDPAAVALEYGVGGVLKVGAAMLADAYSTALFVLGFEGAKKLLEKDASALCFASCVVEAMLVGPRGEVFGTEGFKGELFGE